MKILHSGDIHIGEFPGPVADGINARLLDTLNCMDFLAQTADEQEVDAIIIAGDLFHKSKLWADEMLWEVQKATDWLNKLAHIAPVILLYGTPNHDNMEAFNTIRKLGHPNLYIFTQPDVRMVQTKSGSLQVAALPGFDKGYFRSKMPGLSAEEENSMFTQELSNCIMGLSAAVDPSIPSVLVSHYTVVGCQYENGDHIFMQNEVVLTPSTIDSTPFDLIALGHIHRAQKVDTCSKPTYYCGSINALTFNEEGQEKGFWIHEYGKESATSQNLGKCSWLHIGSKFIKTPYREFLTVEMDEELIKFQNEGLIGWEWSEEEGVEEGYSPCVKDKIVRVLYTCSDEVNKAFDKKNLEKQLYEAGAFHVTEIRPKSILVTVNRQALNENMSVEANLRQYLAEKGVSEEDVEEYLNTAASIIAEASSKTPAGKLIGLFEPVGIDVKNYRSYREESFDFTQITFAMVNGKNGIGKSALFMDAITDCLYEETREGELTGWITNSTDAKSGAITFTFRMGANKWRVSRTRTKSGKVTLNLAEEVNGEWQDRSGDKTVDTQQKIVELLGMDCDTFQSCVLIMQDKYGKFMEADREERMTVLANLIGLNQYELMEKLTKELITDANREVKLLHESINTLENSVSKAPALEEEKSDKASLLAKLSEDKKGKTNLLNEVKLNIASMEEKQKEIDRLNDDISKKRELVKGKIKSRDEWQGRIDRANELLKDEQDIAAKAEEHETLKTEIAILNSKKSQLGTLQSEKKKLEADKEQSENDFVNVSVQIDEINKTLQNEQDIKAKSDEYETSCREIDALEVKAKAYSDLNLKIQQLTSDKERIKIAAGADIDSKENEIFNLKKKALMLDSSNCIDPQNAKCNFLKDAIEARDSIIEKKENLKGIRDSWNTSIEMKENEFQTAIKERDGLGYNEESHKALKQKVISLKPYFEQAAKLEASRGTLEVLNTRKSDIEGRVETLERNVTEKAESIEALKKELEPLADKENRLLALREYPSKKEQIPAAKLEVQHGTEQVKALEDEIKSLTEDGQALKTKIDELLVQLAGLDEKKAKASELERAIADIQTSENEINQRIGAITHELEEIEKSREKLEDERKKAKLKAQEATRLIKLAEAFSQDGIPFQIIRTLVPELEVMSNDILGQMTGGRMTLEMRTEKVQKSSKKEVNALDILITDEHGTLPYLSKSGGQKVKSALAVAFALANIKAGRAGIQLGMMFIDEPPFMDAEGTEAYCDALETMHSRYPAMRVLAISHDESMKARFPQQITVIRTEQGSKVLVA